MVGMSYVTVTKSPTISHRPKCKWNWFSHLKLYHFFFEKDVGLKKKIDLIFLFIWYIWKPMENSILQNPGNTLVLPVLPPMTSLHSINPHWTFSKKNELKVSKVNILVLISTKRRMKLLFDIFPSLKSF